jgi:hypothetical protein
VDTVPYPLLFRKSGSAGNRTRDVWVSSQELWALDHNSMTWKYYFETSVDFRRTTWRCIQECAATILTCLAICLPFYACNAQPISLKYDSLENNNSCDVRNWVWHVEWRNASESVGTEATELILTHNDKRRKWRTSRPARPNLRCVDLSLFRCNWLITYLAPFLCLTSDS